MRRYNAGMIVRPRPHALMLLTLRGSIIPLIMPRVLFIALLSALLVWFPRIHSGRYPQFTAAPLTLLGLALSIFLGFRNSACYERWWEARKLWGQLVTEMRCFARECVALLPDGETRTRVVRRAIGFAYALKAGLREQDALPDTRPFLPPDEWVLLGKLRNRPDAILRAITSDLAACLHAGAITDMLFQVFEARLQAMSAIQTGCERIRNTPTPFAYTLLPAPHRMAVLSAAALRLRRHAWARNADRLRDPCLRLLRSGCAEQRAGRTIRPGAERSAAECATRVIESDLLEALGETDLPPMLQPVRSLLQ
jgi:putative membrane protein